MRRNSPVEHSEFRRLRRRLGIAFAALIGVTAVGAVGFWIIGGRSYSLVDALYMTVITLTTVGFTEVIDMSANPAGRVFTMGLLVVGMGIVAYSVPMMAAFLIEGQLHNIFSRRRMQKSIEEMHDHYIVCGDTTTAWYVAEELLLTNRSMVLVTPDEGSMETATAVLGELPGVIGDPSNNDVLVNAGIERASGVVVCMESDKDNVLVVLTARRLSSTARIVAATERPETDEKLRVAGASAVVSPSRIGGLRIASELVRPKVVSFLDQMLRDDRGSLRVEEVTIPDGAPTIGKTFESLNVEEVAGSILLAVRDPAGNFKFKPEPETIVEAEMTLVIMADAEGCSRLERQLAGRRRSTRMT